MNGWMEVDPSSSYLSIIGQTDRQTDRRETPGNSIAQSALSAARILTAQFFLQFFPIYIL